MRNSVCSQIPSTYADVEKVTLWIRVVVITIQEISGQPQRNPKIVTASTGKEIHGREEARRETGLSADL